MTAYLESNLSGDNIAYLGEIKKDDYSNAIFTLDSDGSGKKTGFLRINYEDDFGKHEIQKDVIMVINPTESQNLLPLLLGIIAIAVIIFFIKRRRETLMVILAITIGVVGPLFTTALNNGMQDAFVGNTVNVYTGHLQIQPNTGDSVISKSESVLSKVTGIKGIVGAAPRMTGGVDIESRTEKMGQKRWKEENSLMTRINMNCWLALLLQK
ncbi:MAG TPA: hypothetical protein VKL21_03240 [Candidatus Methanoperedens sp.]|nr:hypothetical protein [Candidatus Methanoperedens sp.]